MSVFEELKKRVSKTQTDKASQTKTTAIEPSDNGPKLLCDSVRYVVVNGFDDQNKFVDCKVVPFTVDIEKGTFTNLLTSKTFKRETPDDKYLLDDISKQIGEQVQNASIEELTYKALRPFKFSTVIKEGRYDKLLIQSKLQKELKQQNNNAEIVNYNVEVSLANIIEFSKNATNVLTRVKLETQHAKQIKEEKQKRKNKNEKVM